jgi:Lar family restriction alleviation protein
MPADLKPCPFCGFNVESEESYKDPVKPDSGMFLDETIYVIACPDCGAGVAPGSTLEEAVQNWNKRAGQGEEKILLSASPTNTGSLKLPPCKYCKINFTIKLYLGKGWGFCPHCGRQLKASA